MSLSLFPFSWLTNIILIVMGTRDYPFGVIRVGVSNVSYMITKSAPKDWAFILLETKVQFPRGTRTDFFINLSLNSAISEGLVTGRQRSFYRLKTIS
jgi:hypothetical protein